MAMSSATFVDWKCLGRHWVGLASLIPGLSHVFHRMQEKSGIFLACVEKHGKAPGTRLGRAINKFYVG